MYKFLLIDCGLSDNTLESYLHDFKFFDLISNQLCKPPITKVLSLKMNTINHPKTLSRRLSALKIYYSFFDLAWPKDFPKFPKFESLPRVPSEKVVLEILSSIETKTKISDVMRARDRVIFQLLYGCGLRISELSFLNVDDVLKNSFLLKVLGKGSKERLIPISPPILNNILLYLKLRSLLKPKVKKLIINKHGKMISRQGLWKIVKNYASGQDLHPHSFRHAFASHCLNNGMDVRHLQVLLGHSSPNTTQIYTQVKKDNIVKLLQKISPFF